MNDTDYKSILDDTLSKFVSARAKKNELEHEIVKLRQFFFATINMLSDKDRAAFLARFDEMILDEERSAVGLKEAIIRILRAKSKEWLTTLDVREFLNESGFDFSNYKTNPLASVSTTLARMKNNEAESTIVGGVTAYRWKKRPLEPASGRVRQVAKKL